jgi:hypothetical protein
VPLFPRRQVRQARISGPLTASAAKTGERGKAGGLRKLSQGWQQRALEYYDTVGECWYPAQSYARTMEKIRFFPALLNEEKEPEEVEDGPLVEMFERVKDPGGGGRSELAGSYGRLMFLTGDGYLVVSGDENEEAWEFLSPDELRVKPDSGAGRPQEYQRIRAQGQTPEDLKEAGDDEFEPLEGEARVWRLWRRHPRFSAWADSPVHAVLDLYELLHRLALAAASESQSRAANRGLLYIPEELQFEILGVEPGEDPEADAFFSRLIESMTNAIQDPSSASAMAPIVIRGPGVLNTATGSIPMADAIKLIALNTGERYMEVDAWEKVIARISYGLDMPSEFVTGAGDTNHWGGWLLDEQGFRQHVAPVTQRFCDDLASAYLRPAARDENFPGWENVVVGYDPAEAINHPDEITTAKEAWENAVISSAFYRDKIGATEDDAPTDDDLEIIFALRSKTPPGEEEPEGETPPQEGGRGGDVEEGPPAIEDTDQQEQPARNGNTTASLVAAKVLGAAEAYVDRAREVAGSRLIRRSQGCSDCREKIRDVRPALVASTMGPEMVRGIIHGHTTEGALVAGVGENLAGKLRTWGVDGEWPAELGKLVEQHALRTLYEPEAPPLPSGFQSAVQKALQ